MLCPLSEPHNSPTIYQPNTLPCACVCVLGEAKCGVCDWGRQGAVHHLFGFKVDRIISEASVSEITVSGGLV